MRMRSFLTPGDVDEILKIRMTSRQSEDFLAWGLEKNGIFSVRSAYHLGVNEILQHQGGALPNGDRPIWKMFWKISVPQKVKIFAWKLLVGGLPTRETKRNKHMEVQGTCQRCGCAEEDSFHALITCPRSAALWDAMREVWALPSQEQLINTGHEWLFDLLATVSEDERVCILMILWRNWHNRNDTVHGKKEVPIEVSRLFLQSYVSSLIQINMKDGRDVIKGKAVVMESGRGQCQAEPMHVPAGASWPKPPDGWLAVYVDGSYDAMNNVAGVAAVIRDANGNFILASCKYYDQCRDAFEAEVLAFREGIGVALEYTAQPIVIQDCANLAKALKEKGVNRTYLGHIVNEIKEMMREDRELVRDWSLL